MGYREYMSLNIAIVSDGTLGENLACAFHLAGHSAWLASAEDTEWQSSSNTTDGVIRSCISCAAEKSDIIIIATSASEARKVAYYLGDVRSKIIIDMTLNVPSRHSDPLYTLGALRSITGSAHIVKAFNMAGYHQMFSPLFGNYKPEMLMMGDSGKAKALSKIIFREIGIVETYDFGTSENVSLFDEVAKTLAHFMHNATNKLPMLPHGAF